MAKTVETLEEILAHHIRPVVDGDYKRLPVYSYSKIDLFSQCSCKYKLKYVDKNYDNSEAIHLDLGNLCHKICELKGRCKAESKKVDYDYLEDVLENGIKEKTDKGEEMIIGLKEIKKKYFEDFYTSDNKSGMNYQEKTDLFKSKVLHEEMEEPEWNVFQNELSFEFVYIYEDGNGDKKEALIHGFIDRVDTNESGDYRVVDYKTSKTAYDQKKMATPLQQIIYGMAIYNLYGKIPIEYRYDFIFIDEKQTACTKGYLKRAIKKLDKTFNQVDAMMEDESFKPSPTPLCHWCAYCSHTDGADPKFSTLCEYHSNWLPNNKVYTVNKEWTDDNEEKSIVTSTAMDTKPTSSGRKLIF